MCQDNCNGAGLPCRMERFMEPCLLLLLREAPAHGYELMEKLHPLGFTGTTAEMATLYRTLRRLEEEGKLVSNWAKGGQGPRRRVYSLAMTGKTLLRRWVAAIKNNRARLDKFLALYEKAEPENKTAKGD